MTPDNAHVGSSFESWLEEKGLHEEVTAAAIKGVIALQIGEEMKRQRVSKVEVISAGDLQSGIEMAERMQTSRSQLDRLLDPDHGGVTLETLMRAARVIGRELKLELV